MSKKKLRVIQVGLEHDHAPAFISTYPNLSNDYDFLGVIETDQNLIEKFRKDFGSRFPGILTWDEAFALKPDAFIIETEELSLVPNAIRALEAGYHVYMDKPGSENCSEFHRMCDIAKAKNLVLCLGYMYRYNPAVVHAKKLKDEGKLGEIFSVEAQMSVRHENDKRNWLGRFKGGMLYFLGCHLIDLVVMFCGFPEEVIPFNMNTGIEGNNSRDYGFAVYKYKNGISFVKTTATEINGYDRRQLVVTGSLGTIEIRPLEINVGNGLLMTKARETLNNEKAWEDNSTALEFPKFDRYEEMFKSFAEYVRGEKENPYTYEYEAKLHDLIMKSCE